MFDQVPLVAERVSLKILVPDITGSDAFTGAKFDAVLIGGFTNMLSWKDVGVQTPTPEFAQNVQSGWSVDRAP